MFKLSFMLLIILFSMTLSAKSIVVLGDSISSGYGMDVKNGWVTLLQEKITQKNKAYTVFNESISGDTTAGGLARIDKILTRHKPTWVLLELGANDGLRGLSLKQMKNNLANIIQRSEKAGAQVLLLSMRIPPNYGKRYVDMFYQTYPQLAQQFKLTLVPFMLKDVALLKELMQKDGLHPNAKAQPIIVNKVWAYLEAILE